MTNIYVYECLHNKSKYRCKICYKTVSDYKCLQHKIYKYRCNKCDPERYLCSEHKCFKYRCVKCHIDLSCVTCHLVFLGRPGKQCCFCNPDSSLRIRYNIKRVEIRCLIMLSELMQLAPVSHDDSQFGVYCETRVRPDIIYKFKDYAWIHVEIDEDAHQSYMYDSLCERKKMINKIQVLREYDSERSIFVLRVNISRKVTDTHLIEQMKIVKEAIFKKIMTTQQKTKIHIGTIFYKKDSNIINKDDRINWLKKVEIDDFFNLNH